MSESCETCRFWSRDEPSRVFNSVVVATAGYCRRYPPQNSHQERTSVTDWCGEFVSAVDLTTSGSVYVSDIKDETA